MTARREAVLAALVAFAAPLALTVALHPGLAGHLATWEVPSAFGPSHVWGFARVRAIALGWEPAVPDVAPMGYPSDVAPRYLGWAPALLGLPVHALAGPLAAHNVVTLLQPALAGLAAWALTRRLTGIDRWPAALAGVLFGASPYLLGTVANGATEKAALWLLPLTVGALVHAMRGGLAPLLALPLLGLAAAFTDPYLALLTAPVLPLVASAELARLRSVGAAARGVLAGLAWGLAVLPARAYYAAHAHAADAGRGFRNARPPPWGEPLEVPAWQSPVAQPRQLLLEAVLPPSPAPLEAVHLHLLGWPLVVLAVGLGLWARGARGRLSASVMAVAGLTLALGPWLLHDDAWLTWPGGGPLLLPASWLHAVDYPLAWGGQYYRAVPWITLGLAVLLATGLARLPGRTGALVGAALTTLIVAHGVRQGWPHVLRTPRAFPALEACRELGRRDGPGAVLTTPLPRDQSEAGRVLQCAAFHGRPTQAEARHTPTPALEAGFPVLGAARDAVHRQSPAALRDALRGEGYRFLLVWNADDAASERWGLQPATLEALLGPPEVVGGVAFWDLGPVTLRRR